MADKTGIKRELTRHYGDCTIYSSLINGNPEDGICVCGYGWQEAYKGDSSYMYSAELMKKLEGGGLASKIHFDEMAKKSSLPRKIQSKDEK